MDSDAPVISDPDIGRLDERKCGTANRKDPVPRTIKPLAIYLIIKILVFKNISNVTRNVIRINSKRCFSTKYGLPWFRRSFYSTEV